MTAAAAECVVEPNFFHFIPLTLSLNQSVLCINLSYTMDVLLRFRIDLLVEVGLVGVKLMADNSKLTQLAIQTSFKLIFFVVNYQNFQLI